MKGRGHSGDPESRSIKGLRSRVRSAGTRQPRTVIPLRAAPRRRDWRSEGLMWILRYKDLLNWGFIHRVQPSRRYECTCGHSYVYMMSGWEKSPLRKTWNTRLQSGNAGRFNTAVVKRALPADHSYAPGNDCNRQHQPTMTTLRSAGTGDGRNGTKTEVVQVIRVGRRQSRQGTRK